MKELAEKNKQLNDEQVNQVSGGYYMKAYNYFTIKKGILTQGQEEGQKECEENNHD